MSEYTPDAFESTDRPYDDPKVLSELYIYRDLSCTETAEVLGCCSHTVSVYCREYDIKPRYKFPKYLRRKYHGEGMTLEEIGNQIGVGHGVIQNHMEKHGIERRTISESRAKGDVTPLHDREWLREQYAERGRTTTDICDQLGVTSHTVSVWLRRHGIETRPSLAATGADNPNWAGGYKKYYGRNWDEQRQKAIKRDRGECCICGDRDVQVHHIQPFRTYGLENYQEANRLENLMCLCQKHHSRWEGVNLRPQTD
jgi:5-methylcytosine-specific restriction endonuclease McrA